MCPEFTENEVLSLAEKAYNQGDASFDVVPDRCVLLVIDMQDEFVRPGWSPYWVPEATHQVPRIQQLATRCRSRRIPVIYTVFAETHRWLDRPRSSAAMPNRFPDLGVDQAPYFREGRIWHELAPEPQDLVLFKPSYGAFYDTALATILKNLGRDTVIVTGTMTNLCCGTTARQAYERGFQVVFGSDLTATNDPAIQQAELKTLRYGFARVLSLEQILQALR